MQTEIFIRTVLTFSTLWSDAIPASQARMILASHPVQGVLVSGEVNFEALVELLAPCLPKDLAVGGYNLPHDLFERLKERFVRFRAGPLLQPDAQPTVYIFAEPWLLVRTNNNDRVARLDEPVFAEIYRMLEPSHDVDPRQTSMSHLEGKNLLRAMIALGESDLLPGQKALLFMDHHRGLERRGQRVFTVGASLAALSIVLLLSGLTVIGQTLAVLAASTVAASFLSNWFQHKLEKRTEKTVWRRLGDQRTITSMRRRSVLADYQATLAKDRFLGTCPVTAQDVTSTLHHARAPHLPGRSIL